MDEEDLNIRSRSKVLKMYIERVVTRLDGLKMIEDSLMGSEAVQVLRARLEELERDHWIFKDRFNAFTNETIASRKSVQDTSDRLLLLQREHEFLMDRCSILMAEFDFVIRQEKKLMADVNGEDIYTNIEGLKEEMLSTLTEIKRGVIKNDDHGKNRLIDLIKESGEMDDDWEDVKAVKDLAVKLGIQLSCLLVDLMIMLSESDRVVEMFETFRCTLESIEAAKSGCDQQNKKVLEGRSNDGDESKVIDESQLEQVLDKMMSEIFHLELILKDHGVPESMIGKDQVLCFLKARLKIYEDDLKAVELKVNELGVLSSFVHGSKDLDQSLKMAMELKINEIWTQLNEPKEEEPDISQ
ncbi:hypothetical protein Ddye_024417 [Dipteronia dyeriana]|uniref:Uncharacterized protein n=1 Tax=Dipteronia dyeriana TaxID=168575 RepID=A0AAD9TUT4_9ROSI|nr:hypothetical protein Ddye_024417 [Dipteronia dyeriana]